NVEPPREGPNEKSSDASSATSPARSTAASPPQAARRPSATSTEPRLDEHRSIERFNRTLLAEWAYVRTWTSDSQRTRGLAAWLPIYTHHRHHTAIGGPPISRVSNLTGHYT